MNKIFKNKIIIILLLTLAFITIVFSGSNVKGTTINDGHGNPEVGITPGKEITITFGAWSLNENVFCVRHGQNFLPGTTGIEYKVTDYYEITGANIFINGDSINPSDDLLKFAQGVAYILSLDNTWIGDKDKVNREQTNQGFAQNLLWAYLADSSEEYCNNIGMLKGNTSYASNDDYAGFQNAFDTAKNIRDGNTDTSYSAKYYVFQTPDDGSQRFIILESTGEVTENKDVEIIIKKQDSADASQGLEATFKVTFTQESTQIAEKTVTTSSGIGTTGKITISDRSKILKVKIEETLAPEDYLLLNGPIEFSLKYQSGKWVKNGELVANPDNLVFNYSVTNSVVELTVKNELITNLSLDLIKESSFGENYANGTKFKVDLTNVTEIKLLGKYIDSNSFAYANNAMYTFTTSQLFLKVADGGIKIEEIKVSNISNDVEITLEETEAATGHKKIDGSIKISVKWKKGGAELVTYPSYTDEIKNISIVNDDKNKPYRVKIELLNFVETNIKGKVWLDEQTELKTSTGPNGKIDDDDEQGIENIVVCLCDKDGNTKYNTKTDTNGEYEFEKVLVSEGYYVSFEYDGINYIETKAAGSTGTDSHANEDEDERKNFNSKFTTINSDGAYSGVIKKADLKYDLDGTKSKFNPYEEDDITVKTYFKMIATYTIKAEDWLNNDTVIINCGLVKREFDLDLTSNLEYVENKINGQTTYYQYSIDENGNAIVYLRDASDNIISNDDKDITYNQFLYASDYNFKIDDYISRKDAKDESGNSLDNSEDIITGDVLKKEDELSVEVTYKIVLNNQTNKNAYVYKIKDYYSKEFEFVNVFALNTETTQVELSVGNETNSGEYKTKEITLDYKNETVLENTLEMYITFKVPKYKKDEDGNYIIGENGEYILTDAWKNINDIDKDERLTVGNIAEITSYGSDEGYIDMDSAPGNANIGTADERYEDDTDKAGGLKISVTNNEERILSGKVWDDENKDGKYDDDEKLINGVTVQLIELKDIVIAGKTYQLEYIWQETKTGSNKVYQISATGEKINELINPNTDKGKYKFVDYIPGKYIVRYKYGLDEPFTDENGNGKYDEGETYIDENENAKHDIATYIDKNKDSKYDVEDTSVNGNDYKSTYDKTGQNRYKYNSNEFDFTDYLYEATQYSDAYDNEARRLGEMSLFAGTDISKDSITEDKLMEHWMCADTNKFDVAIASNDKQIEYNTNSKTQIAKGVDSTQSNDNSEYNLPNIDFGLMERPATKIELEKHITGLRVNVAGEGNIVDAKFDIAKNDNEGDWTNVLEGVTNNLSTTKSTRDDKGFWKLETDVNDLMNGAELTVEYTYVISNNSTDDYLSEQLVNAYEKLNGKFTCEFQYEGETAKVILLPGEVDGTYTYSELLKELEGKVKLDIRQNKHTNGYYLGTFYYTGETNNVDGLPKIAETTVQVSKIEELLNNEFNFDDKINYSSYGGTNDYFAPVTEENRAHIEYTFYDTNGNPSIFNPIANYKIVQSIPGKNFLATGDRDTGKKIVLTKTLNTSNINNMSYDSYIAEILSYSVASGRRDVNSTPGNLTYSHSDDEKITLSAQDNEGKKYNENDEFWGETIIITSSTGEDKVSTTWWIIIGTISAGIIVVGIFGIKKFVLAKH